jgi:hypothetical protein
LCLAAFGRLIVQFCSPEQFVGGIMAVDWEMLIQKKGRLGKPVPSAAELARLEHEAAEILGVPPSHRDELWGHSLGYGARTQTLIRICSGVPHRFVDRSPLVLVKLFKGDAEVYRRFHRDYFPRLPLIPGNPRFQQTLEAGVWHGASSYAVLQYVDGIVLRERIESGQPLPSGSVRRLLTALIEEIWVPTWESGLRFKDCHKGNFIVDEGANRLVMIDVEQIRKSAVELLDRPHGWRDRKRHERSGLRQLPGLIRDPVSAQGLDQTTASMNRRIREALRQSRLTERLQLLGRDPGAHGASHRETVLFEKLRRLHKSCSTRHATFPIPPVTVGDGPVLDADEG